MGSVARAVLEFDEAVQVPWRPPLASAPTLTVVRGDAVAPGGRAHAVRAARSAPPPGRPALPAVRGRPVAARERAGSACRRCGGSAGCGSGALRLTRRARRLLASLVATGAVGVVVLLGAVVQQDDGLRLAGGASTVVQPGDTLWSIAATVAGDSDVRSVVHEIQRLNGLEGVALVPGQVLELP